jgi:hypothetical protein
MSSSSAAGRPAASPEGASGLGPAHGVYDADWVASAARERDPGLPTETARELAVYAWDHLRETGELDAPEIARRLLADHPDAGATAANVVALSAVTHCQEYEVPLR